MKLLAAAATVQKTQWRISTLLIVTLGFAIFFAGIANLRSSVRMQVNFGALPPSDDALKAWLTEHHHAANLTIQRQQTSLLIQFSRPISRFKIPNPPWYSLGYRKLGSFTFSQGHSVGWWIPIGTLVIVGAGFFSRLLGRVGQRWRNRRQLNKSAGVAEP